MQKRLVSLATAIAISALTVLTAVHPVHASHSSTNNRAYVSSGMNSVSIVSATTLFGMSGVSIDFEDTYTGENVETKYWNSHGVKFYGSGSKVFTINDYNRGDAPAASGSMSITNSAVYPKTSKNRALWMNFKDDVDMVGFHIANGNGNTVARIRAYDRKGKRLGVITQRNVKNTDYAFIAFKTARPMAKISIDYGNTMLSEELDSLTIVKTKTSERVVTKKRTYTPKKKQPVFKKAPVKKTPVVSQTFSCGDSAGDDGLYEACSNDVIWHESGLTIKLKSVNKNYVSYRINAGKTHVYTLYSGKTHYFTYDDATYAVKYDYYHSAAKRAGIRIVKQ
ncbi:MAG: hypothetical protein HOE53_02590 [Candidatus Magasanikbacteria bacterium]|jgi:hypothetical protein|nr:hypothetical protein [Candidatus Magasanikbacteria bacterium]